MKLLEKIGYACCMPSESKDIFGQKIKIVNTFPFNPDSKTAPKTAFRNAGGSWGEGTSPPVFEFENKPFSIKILSLNISYSGGRQYQVIDDKSRLFDLSEDQLMSAIKIYGIKPGGLISGSFVWGYVGSNLKLIVVNGDVYNTMLQNKQSNLLREQKLGKGKMYTGNILKVGKIYRNHNSAQLYIGKFKCPLQKTINYAFYIMNDAYFKYQNKYGNLTYEEKFEILEGWDVRWEIHLKHSVKFLNESSEKFDVTKYRLNQNIKYGFRYPKFGDIIHLYKKIGGKQYENQNDICFRLYGAVGWQRLSNLQRDNVYKIEKKQKQEAIKDYSDSIEWLD